MSEKKWILRVGDQLSDPVSEAQIRQALSQGKLGPDMMASQDGYSWQPLEKLFGGGSNGWMLASYDGSEYGPISKEELDQWVERGSVTANCHVRQSHESGWRSAADLYPQLASGVPLINTGSGYGGSNTSVSSTRKRRNNVGVGGGAAIGAVIFGLVVLRIIIRVIQVANAN